MKTNPLKVVWLHIKLYFLPARYNKMQAILMELNPDIRPVSMDEMRKTFIKLERAFNELDLVKRHG